MADLKTTNIFGDAYINNKVGIATNAPATRLQIGQLSPTAATEGIQFGDDTSARLHRINTGHIRSTGGFSSATFVIADNYLQTNNNLIYPAGFSSTQRLEVGNAAQNAWIDGITIAPGGVVTVAGNISAANLSGTNTGDQTIGNGTITIAAGTGIGVGTTNTFTMNQSGNTTVTVTNSGVTSAVAGTGVSVSGATGAVTFSIGQAVGTGNSPTFTDLFTTGNIRLRNTDPTITFSDTNATSSFIHVNANTFFVLCGPPNSAFGEWAIAANGRWPLEINLTNNNATFGGNVDAISFSGAGTNLTGTAASLTAGTATSANALNAGNNYTVTSLTATSEIGTRGSNIGANLERGDSSIATLRFDADNFRFYAGGTGGGGELVRITEGGNVGIGSSSPGAKLEIGAGTSNVVVAKLTQGNERVRFNYFDLLGYNDGNLWMIGNNPTNTLVLGGGWDWDYQIGIAYTPGTIGVAGGILQIGQISKNNANYTHGNTRFYTNGIERLRITSNGNIGIGTTAPSASLQINSTTAGATLLRTDGTNGTLFSVVDDLSDSLMSVNNSAGLPILEVFADDRIVAGQYGQNDLVVKNNYVGIGTNNPAAKLYVTSSTSVPSAVFLGGNVGIGTAASSDAKLTILGETRIQSSAAYFTHLNYLDGGSNLISMANGGSTVFRGSSNNVTAMTVYGAGNVSINRDLIVNGGTSNPYGNRIIVGGTATTYTLQDATLRPTVYLNGNYPVLTLNNIETSNALHGPTLQFAFNGLTTGGTTSRQIVIGAPGTGAWLDFGFSGGAFGDNTSYNPHNGIGGYSGITAMRLFSNGLLVGSTGAYPNAITSISNALDVRGTGYFSSSLTASVFTGAGTGLTGTAANLTAGAVTNGVYTTGNQSIAGTKTFTGVTSFSNTSDYQIVLDGGGSTWAGINWSDVNGSDNIWFNGQNKTFAIGGGGANISGKKLHVDGGVTIGADYDSTTVLANGLNVQGPVQIGDYTILPINSLSAAGTQSRTYEIARIGIDYNDWNSIGTLEVELHEQYWSRGLKKVYNIWYGYLSNSGSRLVEYRGAGDNNFQCRIGSQVQISGDSYYLPVYVDVRNYGIVDVVVKTNRTITTNTSPGIGYTYVNTAPTPTNISDFTADSDLEISTLGTAKLGGNTILTSASTIAGVNSAGNQNTSGNAATATSASYALSSTNATTAATANSVAWTNVSSRPTAVSAFTNDSGYLTSVTNISGNAATATTASYANALNAANNYSVNSLTEGGYLAYPLREYVINLSAQSTSNFYPIAIDSPPGTDGTWHHSFSIDEINQGGAAAYNIHSMYGEVRGQGWTDQPYFHRIFHNFYDNNEKSLLGIWRPTTSWYGVVVYVRGGKNYYVRTTSRSVIGYNSAVTLGGAVYAIKNSSGVDVSGTSANISETLNLINNPAGFYHSDNAYIGTSQVLNLSTTSAPNLSIGGSAGSLSNMNISQFTNNSGYLTSVTNISGNAGTATTANGLNSSNTYTVNNLTVSTTAQLVGVRETYTSVNISSGVVTIDLNAGTVFRLSYNAVVNSFTINNITAGKVNAFTLVTVPAAGAGGISFTFTGTNASNPKWPSGNTPMATTTVNKFDVFSFIYDGSYWYGFTGGLNY